MSSQLNVDTIVDKAGSGGTNVKIGNTSTYVSENSTVTQNAVQGLGKAWARFNGSGTVAINDSFNIASITDDATGQYSLAINNDMANADYAKVEGGGSFAVQNTGDTASVADFHAYSSSPAYADYTDLQFVILGDLA